MTNETKKREFVADRKRVGVMLDIETMGVRHCAPILELGACAFDLDRGIFDNLGMRVDLQSAMAAGAQPDAATILWWLRQDDDARRALTAPGVPPVPVREALAELVRFLHKHAGATVWCKGATFDFVIVKTALAAAGLPKGWEYRDERCLRTLLGAHPELHALPFEGTPHRALFDARHQARQVLACWRKEGV